MLITSNNKHLHRVTAQLSDYILDTVFNGTFDTAWVENLINKTLDQITKEDFPQGLHTLPILFIILFPDAPPEAICNIMRKLCENEIPENELIALVAQEFYKLGKIVEIENYLDINPNLRSEMFSLECPYYSYLIIYSFTGLVSCDNVALVEKYLPEIIKRIPDENIPFMIAQIDFMAKYCDIAVISKIVTIFGKEIAYTPNTFLVIFSGLLLKTIARFPQKFDEYFNRKEILESFMDQMKDKPNYVDVVCNLDDSSEFIKSLELSSSQTKSIQQSLSNVTTSLLTDIGCDKKENTFKLIIVLNTVNNLIEFPEHRAKVIREADFIKTLVTSIKNPNLTQQLRYQITRILNKLTTATTDVTELELLNAFGGDTEQYHFYKNILTPYHHFQFFQMNTNDSKGKGILPPEIVTLIGVKYLDLSLKL